MCHGGKMEHQLVMYTRPLMRRLGVIARFGIVAAVACMTGVGLASGSNAAASTGSPSYSPEQAGYSVTGGQFRFVSTTVYLRNPLQYSKELLGGYGYSVQLWSSRKVLTLGVSDTTGNPGYSPGAAIFDEGQQAPNDVHCATWDSNSYCAGTPSSWTGGGGALSYAPGDTVTLSIYYDKEKGTVQFLIRNDTAKSSSGFTYHMGTGVSFSQARIGAEAGCYAPWDDLSCAGISVTSGYNAPTSPAVWGRFTQDRVTTYSGTRSGLTGAFQTSKVYMTSQGISTGTIEASSSALSTHSETFTASLQP